MNTLITILILLIPWAAQAQPRYFGYYASEIMCSWEFSCSTEAKDHTNVVWIAAQVDTKDGASCGQDYHWQCQIVTAQGNGQKVVLRVMEVIFDWRSLWIWPDWSTRMAEFDRAVGPFASSIVALTHVDEPFLQPFLDGRTITKDQLRSFLEYANQILKSDPLTAPIPIAVTFASQELIPGGLTSIPGNTIPWGYDWVGFDCYGEGVSCSNDAGLDIYQVTAILLSRLSSTQRSFFVPDAMVCSGLIPYCAHTTASLKARIDTLWALIQATPVTIGVFPYCWTSYDGGSWGMVTGMRDLPGGVQLKYKKIGQTVRGY